VLRLVVNSKAQFFDNRDGLMNQKNFVHRLLLVIVALLQTASGAELVDDRDLSIHSRSEADRMRERLIHFVWGTKQLPDTQPVQVTRSVASPITGVENLGRVDALRIAMECDQQTVTYHFIPQKPNRRLVIVHQGHVCQLDRYGVGDLIRDLLREGYSVLGAFMPKCRPDDCTGSCTAQHNAMFASLVPAAGSPMKFFLEPIALSLNYFERRHRADDFPRYREFHMAGLSGGGWTTTIYAAIDPRIKLSFPVAGTMPLYLRSGGSVGDLEQTLPAFYGIAGYPDLYVLGSFGRGRAQVQILNRRDDCCFGEAQHRGPPSYDEALRNYEWQVQASLKRIRPGNFRVEIDEAAPSHLISSHASSNVILSELKQRNGGR
jgi:hypothetical protein